METARVQTVDDVCLRLAAQRSACSDQSVELEVVRKVDTAGLNQVDIIASGGGGARGFSRKVIELESIPIGGELDSRCADVVVVIVVDEQRRQLSHEEKTIAGRPVRSSSCIGSHHVA